MKCREACCLAWVLAFGGSCRDAGKASPPVKAAQVSNARPESALSTVALTPDAERRLGIEVVPVQRRALPAAIMAPGEVVLPPGNALLVSAPIVGTVAGPVLAAGTRVTRGETVMRLVPLPSGADLSSAQIRLEAARKKRDRAQQLLTEGAGSQRSLEEADADLAVAQSNAGVGGSASLNLKAPQSGLIRDLHVGAGQAVAAGAALFQVDSQVNLWVRASLYVGDVPGVDRTAPAQIHGLGPRAPKHGLAASPIEGPPSGNAEAASEDLYFVIPASGVADFRPGQRVSVAVPSKSTGDGLVVPWSAVVVDLFGSSWVYGQIAPHTFSRHKVQVVRVVDGWAVIDRGLKEGDAVVSVGAQELFGTEFGAGK